MRRSVLLTLAALGAVLSLLGVGLYAALTDTARTGTNSADSAGLPASADLRLAPFDSYAPRGAWSCGAFSEDLDTPVFTATDITPDSFNNGAKFCLQNVGSQTVAVSGTAIELFDLELGCTGDEALYDDTCGDGQSGELSSALHVFYEIHDCQDGSWIGGGAVQLAGNTTTPHAIGTVAPGGVLCLGTPAGEYTTWSTTAQIQAAQSDRSTWRFAFTGTVPVEG